MTRYISGTCSVVSSVRNRPKKEVEAKERAKEGKGREKVELAFLPFSLVLRPQRTPLPSPFEAQENSQIPIVSLSANPPLRSPFDLEAAGASTLERRGDVEEAEDPLSLTLGLGQEGKGVVETVIGSEAMLMGVCEREGRECVSSAFFDAGGWKREGWEGWESGLTKVAYRHLTSEMFGHFGTAERVKVFIQGIRIRRGELLV